MRESLRFSLCALVAVGSAVIAAARAHLWSSFRRRSESPLLATRKQRGKKKSLASSAAADLFPDSLPARRGALGPSGCVHAPNPSPLPATKARVSAPSVVSLFIFKCLDIFFL